MSLYFEPGTFSVQNEGNSYSYTSSGNTMRFEVRSGDQPSFDSSSVERSEIASGKELKFGQTYAMSYKFMIEPGQALNADWMLLGQVHHSGGNGTPPFAIEVNDGVMQVVYRTSSSTAAPTVLWKDDAQIERGHWYDVKAEIKFDPFGDGLVNMWLDGQQIVNYNGAIGYNDDEPGYLKMGIYRDASSETVAVNYDNVQVVEGTMESLSSQAPAPQATAASLGDNAIDVSHYDMNRSAPGDQTFEVTDNGHAIELEQLRYLHDTAEAVPVIEGSHDADLRPEGHYKCQGLNAPHMSDFVL